MKKVYWFCWFYFFFFNWRYLLEQSSNFFENFFFVTSRTLFSYYIVSQIISIVKNLYIYIHTYGAGATLNCCNNALIEFLQKPIKTCTPTAVIPAVKFHYHTHAYFIKLSRGFSLYRIQSATTFFRTETFSRVGAREPYMGRQSTSTGSTRPYGNDRSLFSARAGSNFFCPSRDAVESGIYGCTYMQARSRTFCMAGRER